MKKILELNQIVNKWDSLSLNTGGEIVSKSNSFHPLDPRCYIDLLRRDQKALISSEIWPTSQCNHDCTFCSSKRYGLRGFISLDWPVMERLVNDIADMGSMVVRLSGGGEPALYKDLSRAIELIAKRNMLSCLITNGSALSEKLISSLAQRSSLVRISFNGGDKESYRKVHRVDNFDKALDVMSCLVKERNQKDRRNELLLGATFIITKDNFRTISKATQMVKERGFDFMIIRGHNPVKYLLEGANRDIFEQEILASHKLKDTNFFVSGKVKSLDGTKPKKPLLPKCYATHFRTYVDFLGQVFSCFNAICIGSNPCGNVIENSIKDVWGKGQHLHTRNQLERGKYFDCCRNSKYHCGYGDFNRNIWELEQSILQNPAVQFRKKASNWAETFMPKEDWF